MKSTRIFLFVLWLMVGWSSGALATVIFSESFETPVAPTLNPGWLNYGIGYSGSQGTSFVGDSGQTWTIDSGNIEIQSPIYWVAQDGVQSIDLNGYFTRGSMLTSVSLTPGNYELSFHLSKVPFPSLGDQQVEVQWDGATVGSSPYTVNWTTSPTNMNWMKFAIQLSVPDTGLPTSTHQIRFASLISEPGASEFGPTIDSVSLTLIPEPSTAPSKIAFMSNRDGNNEIYVMNAADGSDQTNLTNQFIMGWRSCMVPRWNPDCLLLQQRWQQLRNLCHECLRWFQCDEPH